MSVISLTTEDIEVLYWSMELFDDAGEQLTEENSSVRLVVVVNVSDEPVLAEDLKGILEDHDETGTPERVYLYYPLFDGFLQDIITSRLSYKNAIGWDIKITSTDGEVSYISPGYPRSVSGMILTPKVSVFLKGNTDNPGDVEDASKVGASLDSSSNNEPEEKPKVAKKSLRTAASNSTIVETIHEGGDLYDLDEAQLNDLMDKIEHLPEGSQIVSYSAGSASEYMIATKNGPEAAWRWIANKLDFDQDEISEAAVVMSKEEAQGVIQQVIESL